MTYIWPNKGKFSSTWVPKFNPSTPAITGLPTNIYVYQVGTTNRVTLYTDRTGATTLTNNPVPTGVSTNSAGLDANGNLILFADVGEYDLVVDGQRTTVEFAPAWTDVGAAFDQLSQSIITATTAN